MFINYYYHDFNFLIQVDEVKKMANNCHAKIGNETNREQNNPFHLLDHLKFELISSRSETRFAYYNRKIDRNIHESGTIN